tara:strand:- start:76 stop:1380 length:1305 start_codon:yes stop_codon:yes gene_type:complete
MKKKILILSFLTSIALLLLIIFTVKQNIFSTRDNLRAIITDKYPNISLRKEMFKKESVTLNLINDYNVKFLPETQFLDLNLDKKKIVFNKNFIDNHQNSGWSRKSFYLDMYEDLIILVDYLGGIYFLDNSELLKKETNKIIPRNITSNLNPTKVLDIKVYKKKIYVSYKVEIDDCQYLKISVADLNFKSLNFDIFYSSKVCANFIQAGRIVPYQHKGIDGLLFSTSDQIPDDTDNELYTDFDLHPPQDNTSIFGKILFFNIQTKDHIIFSKGHRNIQGLYAEDDLILATEHGPKGGDEINKIKFKKNYGWPLASYGEKYSSYNSETYYKKKHYSYGFEEPIFAYVPSIAISEIMRLPNEFSESFKNNFIISTLAHRHLHRVKFDQNFDKLIFDERIFINERVRDIIYDKDNDLILLAFEEKGELGILSNNQRID